jgi:hypothetical protein
MSLRPPIRWGRRFAQRIPNPAQQKQNFPQRNPSPPQRNPNFPQRNFFSSDRQMTRSLFDCVICLDATVKDWTGNNANIAQPSD